MAIHKLDLGDFDEIDYLLVAIHTTLEDYRLAYLINQKLDINLSKNKDDIQVNSKEGEAKFSRFHHYNSDKTISWNLIQNRNEVFQEKKDSIQNLFSDTTLEVSTKVYLLPEFKKADYFLKIENNIEMIDLSIMKKLLNTIDSISTVYTVDINKIKSKNNLIF
ncbi:IPExxxVDY family protein [Flavobacterium sp. K5-23]|uniref:IPExxxVDY family protein n=1 Tax=Flavobacterium sp. K5-23 TaxID=2746225 RepID=UPI00200FA53E|nr:IPExxxVDY family protein [Flavobacterium sp. K5-23]UQD55429.1 IPExxxVDY family protein [Flavobacterium sp. K5-23]